MFGQLFPILLTASEAVTIDYCDAEGLRCTICLYYSLCYKFINVIFCTSFPRDVWVLMIPSRANLAQHACHFCAGHCFLARLRLLDLRPAPLRAVFDAERSLGTRGRSHSPQVAMAIACILLNFWWDRTMGGYGWPMWRFGTQVVPLWKADLSGIGSQKLIFCRNDHGYHGYSCHSEETKDLLSTTEPLGSKALSQNQSWCNSD